MKRGSRTTAFSEQQYDSIIATIKSHYPAEIKNLEDQKQHDYTTGCWPSLSLSDGEGSPLAMPFVSNWIQ